MAIKIRSAIKEFYRTGLKPKQQEFWDWLDSYWHKNDLIPISSVDGLETALGNAGGGSGGSASATIELYLSRRVSEIILIDANNAGSTLNLANEPDLRDLQIWKNGTPNFHVALSGQQTDVSISGLVMTFNFTPLEAGDIVRAIYTKVV